MDKLLNDLLAEVEAIADDSILETIESIKLGMAELDDKSPEDAMAIRRDYFRTLAELKSGLEANSSSDSDNDVLDTIGTLYELFSSVAEGINSENPVESNADLYGILNSLMYCVSDLENAIKYLKEMALLLELSKEGVAQAAENTDEDDDAVAATAEKPMKTDGGNKYPAEAYLYVPDPKKPSTWKIRIWETPEKKVTVAQLGRAAAAIGKGFRGKKAQIPLDEIANIKGELRSLYKKEEDVPEVLKSGRSKAESEEKEASMEEKEEVKTEEVKKEVAKAELEEEEKEAIEEEPKEAEAEEVKEENEEEPKEAKSESDDESKTDEITQLKEENKNLQSRIAALESERTATQRMAVLKGKGLDVVFATEEDKEAEIKRLMSMTDEEFEGHVGLMEKTRDAFASKAEESKANAEEEEDTEAEEESAEEPKPAVAVAEDESIEGTVEVLMSLFDN